MRFAGTVGPDGTFRPWDPGGYLGWFRARRGQRVEVELRDEAALHSDRQRRYWFGCVVPTVNEVVTLEKGHGVPYPKTAIHGMLMRVFCEDEVEGPDGPERPSFSELSKSKTSKLIDDVKAWLWDKHQVRLPEPEEWSGR